MILAPVVAGRKGEQAELLEELRAQGFTRVRIDGTVHELDSRAAPREERQALGRRGDRPAARARRRQAAPRRIVRDRAAPRRRQGAGGGDRHRERSTSSRRSFACPACDYALRRARAAPVLLQQPDGRLPALRRPGQRSSSSTRSASSRIPNLSLASGAIRGWDRRNHFYYSMLQSLARALRLRRRAALGDARRARAARWCLHGSGKEKIAVPVPRASAAAAR